MTQRFDYIIVGSGIAGLYAALLARQPRQRLRPHQGQHRRVQHEVRPGRHRRRRRRRRRPGAAPRRTRSTPAPASSTRGGAHPRRGGRRPHPRPRRLRRAVRQRRRRGRARPRGGAQPQPHPPRRRRLDRRAHRAVAQRPRAHVPHHDQGVRAGRRDRRSSTARAAGLHGAGHAHRRHRALRRRRDHPRDRRLRPALPRQHEPGRRDRRRHRAGLPRRRRGAGHGVHPVPPDGAAHARRADLPHLRSGARRRRRAAQRGRRALHAALQRAGGAGAARHRRPRDRQRDGGAPAPTASTSTSRISPRRGSPRASRRSTATASSTALDITKEPVPGLAGRALPDGRRPHEHLGRDDDSRPLRLRRSRLHRRPRRQPPREQLAARDDRLRQADHRAHARSRAARRRPETADALDLPPFVQEGAGRAGPRIAAGADVG